VHFDFSDHAIQRFIERHAPGLNTVEAHAVLIDAATHRAAKLKSRTLRGDQQWQLRNPDVVIVTKTDAGRIIVKTVLPSAQVGLTAEEAETVCDYLAQPDVAAKVEAVSLPDDVPPQPSERWFEARRLEREVRRAKLAERLAGALSGTNLNIEAQRLAVERDRIRASARLDEQRLAVERARLKTERHKANMEYHWRSTHDTLREAMKRLQAIDPQFHQWRGGLEGRMAELASDDFIDRKGGDPSEWGDGNWPREFPHVS